MWDALLPLAIGSGPRILRVTSDFVASYGTGSYDLFREAGFPSEPVTLTLIVEAAARCATVSVSSQFNPLSVIEIIVQGNAQLVGSGGFGGQGGYADTDAGENFDGPGLPGTQGGAALLISRNIRLNLDNGFLYGGGGGGGGGGGAAPYRGGSGGGGGRGFNNASGGPGEFANGTNGTAGSISAPGIGGTGNADGGNGGNWGASGFAGQTSLTGRAGGAAGLSGRAIEANLAGLTVTLTGAKNQTTLTSEFRLLGGITPGLTITGP